MKNWIMILIVFVILVLSVGPLSYFFGAGAEINSIPYNNDSDKNLLLSLSGNATGKIIQIMPYISYVGVSQANDESVAREVMSYVNYTDNYTLHVSLNPFGAGYRHEIFIPLKNESDALEVGFKAKLNLDPFFQDSYTTTLGVVQLDDNFTAAGRTIRASNKTAAAVLLYSSKKNQPVRIFCPEMTVTEAGALVGLGQLCADLSQGYKHGLSFMDYLFNEKEANKTMTLNITLIDHVEIDGTFKGLLNETQLRDEIGQEMAVYNPSNESGAGTITVYLLDVENSSLISGVQDALKSHGVNVTRTSKIGVVTDVPKEIDLNGSVKRLYHIPYFTVRLGMGEGTGEKTFTAKLITVFGEVTDIIAY
ncbi:MAG: hypothetical protein QXO69_00310 [archaeon]